MPPKAIVTRPETPQRHPTRRRVLVAGSAAALASPLLGSLAAEEAAGTAVDAAPEPDLYAAYPTADPARVREMVGVAHFDLERVRELVAEQPELAKASWDWGYGDWESALGAASHVGRREIAELLIEHGARPNLFTYAMLGHLDAVKALIAARPGIQRQHGPHGITLLAHARAGGEQAEPVARYLEALGDADPRYRDEPLSETEREALFGAYVFGPDAEDRFVVLLNSRDQLSMRRGENGVSRVLFHQGGHEFHPAGAPSARMRFAVDGDGRVVALTVSQSGRSVEAKRVATPA